MSKYVAFDEAMHDAFIKLVGPKGDKPFCAGIFEGGHVDWCTTDAEVNEEDPYVHPSLVSLFYKDIVGIYLSAHYDLMSHKEIINFQVLVSYLNEKECAEIKKIADRFIFFGHKNYSVQINERENHFSLDTVVLINPFAYPYDDDLTFSNNVLDQLVLEIFDKVKYDDVLKVMEKIIKVIIKKE